MAVKTHTLQRRAEEMGVDEGLLDEAGDTAAIIALVMAKADERARKAGRRARLKDELLALKPRALQRRAEAAGVADEELEDADDSEAIVGLILARMGEREGYGKPPSAEVATESARALPPGMFHAFLTHDWGKDGSGRGTHDRVKKIHRLLSKRGLCCWLDEEQMKGGDIVTEMAEGIDGSVACVVFVTKNLSPSNKSSYLTNSIFMSSLGSSSR